MEKTYSGRYPERGEQQDLDINKAVMRMLNCRRYLASEGFKEGFSDKTWYGNNCVNNISGEVIFPDGSEVSSRAFITMANTSERDSLLERMIEKGSRFKRIRDAFDYSSGYNRNNVIRTTFIGDDYQFTLSVIDTTREGIIFPVRLFFYNPKKFSFNYDVLLKKGIISDKDLEVFEKYRKGLEEAVKQDSLVAYASQTPQRKAKSDGSVKVEPIQTDFINPWDIDIPRLGDKK